MNLPLSVWSSFFVQLSPEEMVDEFAAAGYSVTEFSDEHGAVLLQRAAESGKSPAQVGAELKAYADAKGVSFPQGHLYLAVDLCAPDAAEILLPWLDLYVSLGVRAGVLHPSCRQPELSSEQRFDHWVTTLKTLTDHLAGTEMSIALENAGGILLTAEALNQLIDAVGDEHLGICLDTGHLNLIKLEKFVRLLTDIHNPKSTQEIGTALFHRGIPGCPFPEPHLQHLFFVIAFQIQNGKVL